MLTEYLTHLFNLSVQTGGSHSAWKRACVTPVFKNKGDRQSPSNYRPLPILPALGKILAGQISKHRTPLNDHNVISNCQFGLRPSLSTTKHFLSSLIILLTIIIRGSPCSIFQKMDPNIAIFDLVKYGVNGKTVTCFPLGSNFHRVLFGTPG